MSAWERGVKQLEQDFSVTTCQLKKYAAAFSHCMKSSLAGQPSSLAMLPSWLASPCGTEQGNYLALDFGGTHVRVLSVKLLGQGSFAILARQSAPLLDPAGSYNYTTPATEAEELFDFLAGLIEKVAAKDTVSYLGHTFSFPCCQTHINEATLLYWTKEIAVSGVPCRNVTELLTQALRRQNLHYIQPLAVVNDTITTVLTAAYRDASAHIGSICGTGHNTCYLEPKHPATSQPMYVNIESGNFDQIPGNPYDEQLDAASERPGAGRLEKMCSGRYIGELFRLVWTDLARQGLLKQPVPEGIALSGWHMSECLSGRMDWLADNSLSADEQTLLHTASRLISNRSARLVAATWAAILLHIDPQLTNTHTIAVDGSLYEKLPGYQEAIAAALAELLGDKVHQVNCKLVKDGSGVGAAIAAAIAARSAT